jgi:proline racemase
MGFIIMEPEDTPPMSGSNSICVATVLLGQRHLPDERAGDSAGAWKRRAVLVEVLAECRGGKAERITVATSPPSPTSSAQRWRSPASARSPVDTAYGGDSFVLVDAQALGLPHRPGRGPRPGGNRHPDHPRRQRADRLHPPGQCEWSHISFCQIAAPVESRDGLLTAANAVDVQPGKIDRSPTGTGASARMAVMRARGEMQVGDHYLARSIIGSEFLGRIEADTEVGGRAAIIPSISGRAWITGARQEMLDPDDPWPSGYRLSDTWPRIGSPS